MNASATDTPLVTAHELRQLYRRVIQRPAPGVRRGASRNPGDVLSLFRGQGMELHDSRPYQPGDAPRDIDWRATARSGKPLSKVFVDERQHPLFLVIDRGAHMRFGTRRQIKAAAAARAAAIFAFTALKYHQRVAGLIVEDDILRHHPAARTLDGVLRLLGAAAAPLPPQIAAAEVNLDAVFTHISRSADPGALICYMSDFHAFGDGTLAHLLELTQRHEPLAVMISDPGEAELTDVGPLRIRPPLSGARYTLDTGDATLRTCYRDARAERQRALIGLLRRARIQHIGVCTDKDVWRQLDVLQ